MYVNFDWFIFLNLSILTPPFVVESVWKYISPLICRYGSSRSSYLVYIKKNKSLSVTVIPKIQQICCIIFWQLYDNTTAFRCHIDAVFFMVCFQATIQSKNLGLRRYNFIFEYLSKHVRTYVFVIYWPMIEPVWKPLFTGNTIF